MSQKLTPELEVLLLYDDLLNFSKELEEPEKMIIFAELQKDFEAQQLLQEINAEDDNTTRQ